MVYDMATRAMKTDRGGSGLRDTSTSRGRVLFRVSESAEALLRLQRCASIPSTAQSKPRVR